MSDSEDSRNGDDNSRESSVSRSSTVPPGEGDTLILDHATWIQENGSAFFETSRVEDSTEVLQINNYTEDDIDEITESKYDTEAIPEKKEAQKCRSKSPGSRKREPSDSRSKKAERSRSRSKKRENSHSRRKSRSRSRRRSRSHSQSHRRGRRSHSRKRSRSRSRTPSEGARLHVAELDVDVRKRDLEKVFEKYGRLKEIWMARNPPCFAFVVYRHQKDSERAMRETDGLLVGSCRIKVTQARPRVRGGRFRGYDPNQRCYQCGEVGHFSRNCTDTKFGYKRPPTPPGKYMY